LLDRHTKFSYTERSYNKKYFKNTFYTGIKSFDSVMEIVEAITWQTGIYHILPFYNTFYDSTYAANVIYTQELQANQSVDDTAKIFCPFITTAACSNNRVESWMYGALFFMKYYTWRKIPITIPTINEEKSIMMDMSWTMPTLVHMGVSFPLFQWIISILTNSVIGQKGDNVIIRGIEGYNGVKGKLDEYDSSQQTWTVIAKKEKYTTKGKYLYKEYDDFPSYFMDLDFTRRFMTVFALLGVAYSLHKTIRIRLQDNQTTTEETIAGHDVMSHPSPSPSPSLGERDEVEAAVFEAQQREHGTSVLSRMFEQLGLDDASAILHKFAELDLGP
jgi:hypothetical protein